MRTLQDLHSAVEALQTRISTFFGVKAEAPDAATAAAEPKLADLATAIEGLNTRFTQFAADLAARDTTISELNAAAVKAKTDHEAAMAAKETEVEQRANIMASERLAKAGHPGVKEEVAPSKIGDQVATLRASLATATPSEKFTISMKIKELLSAKN
jgi:hypothetical protein